MKSSTKLVSVSGETTDYLYGRIAFLFEGSKMIGQKFELDTSNPDTKEIVVKKLRALADSLEEA